MAANMQELERVIGELRQQLVISANSMRTMEQALPEQLLIKHSRKAVKKVIQKIGRTQSEPYNPMHGTFRHVFEIYF